jgi:hypothetical protein
MGKGKEDFEDRLQTDSWSEKNKGDNGEENDGY